jgi:hypothetical protein
MGMRDAKGVRGGRVRKVSPRRLKAGLTDREISKNPRRLRFMQGARGRLGRQPSPASRASGREREREPDVKRFPRNEARDLGGKLLGRGSQEGGGAVKYEGWLRRCVWPVPPKSPAHHSCGWGVVLFANAITSKA